MSERGVFAVDRGIWEHDLLSENEPFSRREAWLWLVSEAAWKPHRRRLIGRLIELQRGQLAGSLRFIASKWRWSEPRVRRFLGALKSEQMVDAKTDAGVTVITICKYDEYQRVSLPSDAMSESAPDAAATQQRRKVEDREDKETETSSLRSEVRARSKGEKLPPAWKPTESHYAEGAQMGVDCQQVDHQAEDMRLWARANEHRAVARKSNWDLTFSGWMRRNKNGNGPRGHRADSTARPSASGADAILAGMGRLAARIGSPGGPAGRANREIPGGFDLARGPDPDGDTEEIARAARLRAEDDLLEDTTGRPRR